MKRPKETEFNAQDQTVLETPVEAAVWLQHFRTMNAQLLDRLQLVTTSTWKLSETESIASGEPLSNLIAAGIDRIKHSNQCLRGVLQEIKTHTNAGNAKTMVVLNGANCVWEMSFQRYTDKRFIPAEKFHVLQSFKEVLKNDWKNAAVVVSVSTSALALAHRKLTIYTVPSFMPQYLLGKSGFEFFEPFIPISLEKLTQTEIESMIDYYIDMNYIQHPRGKTKAARSELKFLSGSNPRTLRDLCKWI